MQAGNVCDNHMGANTNIYPCIYLNIFTYLKLEQQWPCVPFCTPTLPLPLRGVYHIPCIRGMLGCGILVPYPYPSHTPHQYLRILHTSANH